MSRFADQVRDQYGILIPGVSIYVYVWDANAQSAGSLETLTADDSSPLANPVISDAYGEFHFNAPDGAKLLSYHFGGKVILEQQIQVGPIPAGPPGGDGALAGLFTELHTIPIPSSINIVASSGYSQTDVGSAVYVHDAAVDAAYVTANPRSSFIETGGRGFRLSSEQIFTPQMFGAVADWNGTTGTDDGAAFIAALATLKAAATTGYGYGSVGAAKLFVPRGAYNLNATTLDLDFGLIIEGESVGYIGPGSTVLKWADGTTGIRTQKNNTTGATGTKTPVTNSGIATIRNFLLQGGYGGTTESESHGIQLRETAHIENVAIYNFPGDGVHVLGSAGSGAPTEGAPNIASFFRVFVQGCRNGFFFDGADANACSIIHCSAIANRQWGYWDSSFIGCYFFVCHSSGNGSDGTAGSIATGCSYSGHHYYIKPGQATGASTNAPSGTTADNAYWGYKANPSVGDVPWVTATPFREGGGYKSDDPATAGQFVSCYTESDENPGQVAAPAQVIGGPLSAANVGSGFALRSDTSGAPIFGPNFGSTHPGTSYFDFSQNFHKLSSRKWVAGTPTEVASITLWDSFFNVYDNVGFGHLFDISGAPAFAIGAHGFGYNGGGGIGGTVTQLTSRTTAVELDKPTGSITLFSAAGSASWQTFIVNASGTVHADTIILSQQSGTDKYQLHVTRVFDGGFDITFATTGGTTTEQPVFNYAVVKGANS